MSDCRLTATRRHPERNQKVVDELLELARVLALPLHQLEHEPIPPPQTRGVRRLNIVPHNPRPPLPVQPAPAERLHLGDPLQVFDYYSNSNSNYY